MTDPIDAELYSEWRPHVIDEPDKKKVRAWLQDQDSVDIKLFCSTFEYRLGGKYPARFRLLEEELERRNAPPPDRVTQIIAKLRSNWLVAGCIVLVIAIGSLATLWEHLQSLLPPSQPKADLDPEKVQALGDAVDLFEKTITPEKSGGN